MKLSSFFKYDNSSKRKISLIAIIPKYSNKLICTDEPKISEHKTANKLFYNSVFGTSIDIDFSSLYSPSIPMSHPFKKIKKISESIQINYKFSKQDTIKRKKLSRVAKNQVFKIKSDITTIP